MDAFLIIEPDGLYAGIGFRERCQIGIIGAQIGRIIAEINENVISIRALDVSRDGQRCDLISWTEFVD
jgi:hypothetical protein